MITMDIYYNLLGSYINLATIGATVLEEDKYVVPNSIVYLGAGNAFTNGCDNSSAYYVASDGFTGMAFKLSLGAKFRINQFWIKNTHNNIYNDR